MKQDAFTLANSVGIASEHPDFPVIDWRQAVVNEETREGYWDWVVSEMRYQNHAWIEQELGDD